MPLQFRPAIAADAEAAIPLIYSSGPDAFEYGFTIGPHRALDFLRHAFADGRGFFGWRNHTVAVLDGQVAGIGAFYSGHEYGRLSQELIAQVLRFHPLLSVPRIIRRSLQLKALMPPPSRRTHYVAYLGVRPDLRSQGIGAALLRHHQDVARQLGRSKYALDVSVGNPRGQALYERLGFKPTREQHFPGPAGAVPDTRRMEILLDTAKE
jgi:ribosomal protein S18 acetylase RimI-like enzyme